MPISKKEGVSFMPTFDENPFKIAIIITDELGKVISASSSIVYFIGLSPKELIGRSICEFVDEKDLPTAKECLLKCLSKDGGSVTTAYQVLNPQKKSKNLVLATYHGLLKDVNPKGIAISWSDISKETKARQELKRERARLQYLFYDNPEAIVLTDKNNFIVEVNDPFCKLFGYDKEEVRGKHVDEIVAKDSPYFEEASHLSSLVTSGKALDLESVRKKKDGTLFEVAITAIPVKFGDEFFGIYTIYRDISERKRAARKLKEYVGYLERAWIQTISALGFALEQRDPYTAGHQRRVAELAKAIALKLQLTEDDVKALYMASLVHDIGKIRIPAEILTKPSKLTFEEYELVKTHPRVGFEILKSIEFPWPIAEIVYQHHEKLDGSGYPRGLWRSEIHPLALILTAADVVEAMVSDRPYRKGLPVVTVLAEIEAFKDTYYDPWVVEACSSLLKNGEFSFKD